MKQISYEILKNLRLKNGLFIAAPSSIYNKAWLRDNIYSAIGLEIVNVKEAIQTYHALLDILKKHEYKINFAIKEKPKHAYQYIHARYNPETLEEYHEEWGNKQNDAIGALLFKIAELLDKKLPVLRNLDDYRIIQKLVFYLESIEYWHDKDNGMWEEYEEIHASSVGACLAGLKAIANHVYVPSHLIEKGQETLNLLLPRESETKETDLALLSLIYPYNIVNDKQKSLILKNVEEKLLREKGVIRYINDQYFNKGKEASWTFGLAWLAVVYKDIDKIKYEFYLQKTIEAMTDNHELPELYINDEIPNENTPLAWTHAMHLVALS